MWRKIRKLLKEKFWNERVLKNQSFIAKIFRIYWYNIHNYEGWKIFHNLLQLSLVGISLILTIEKLVNNGVFEKLIAFVNIWPMHQWIFSLISLVLMYWLIGSWYNKKLAREGGWISWQARVNMILLDLTINLGLGIYYMDARETLMGSIMLNCPIAISPVIFFIEFVVFVWYYRKYVLKKKDK